MIEGHLDYSIESLFIRVKETVLVKWPKFRFFLGDIPKEVYFTKIH
jgi:hypothetical protein